MTTAYDTTYSSNYYSLDTFVISPLVEKSPADNIHVGSHHTSFQNHLQAKKTNKQSGLSSSAAPSSGAVASGHPVPLGAQHHLLVHRRDGGPRLGAREGPIRSPQRGFFFSCPSKNHAGGITTKTCVQKFYYIFKKLCIFMIIILQLAKFIVYGKKSI